MTKERKTKETKPVKNATGNRISGIDSVRAFAALSVMCAHIVSPQVPHILRGLPFDLGSAADLGRYLFTGNPAVVAFFVISGFCIHHPYVNNPLPVFSFLAGRFTRIMIPVAVAMAIARSINLASFNLVDGFILWSIVCELFYYMLYPAFRALSKRVPWKLQLLISLVISYAIIITKGSDQYGNPHVYGPWLNWVVALPSWLAGCVLAERVAAGRKSPTGVNIWIWRAAVALTASGLFWLTMNTRLGYYLTLNAFTLLVYFWLAAEIDAARDRRSRFFEWVGTWSYSIYLFHIMVFAQAGRMFYLQPWHHVAAVVPATLLFTYLMYLIVELPSHKLARLFFTSLRARSLNVYVR